MNESAVRTSMAAAAAAGGALAVVVPTVSATTDTTAPAQRARDSALLRLASDEAADGDVRMIASVVPVTHTQEPEPQQVDVSELLKAAGLADVARKAEAREAAARCDTDLDELGRVKPWVREAARFLSCLYDEPDLIGVAQRGGSVSDHPKGLAIDIMVRGERGDRIAACALANRRALGISYVIWKQRVNYGDGWEWMEDRGGVTENHYDHVHISFARSAPGATPLAARCS